MTLEILDLVAIMLAALVMGVFWGPWLALSRSMETLSAEVFLAVVHRMDRNLGAVMTWLMPTALLSMAGVLLLSYRDRREMFWLTAVALILFVLALVVTTVVEVPIVKSIRAWTLSTMPPHWAQLRDRWTKFHLVRVSGGVIGLACLAAGGVL